MKDLEWKPCPFCGGTNLEPAEKLLYYKVRKNYGGFFDRCACSVRCRDCNCELHTFPSGKFYRQALRELNEKWNRRTP